MVDVTEKQDNLSGVLPYIVHGDQDGSCHFHSYIISQKLKGGLNILLLFFFKHKFLSFKLKLTFVDFANCR